MNRLLCIKNFSEKLHRASAHQQHHSFLIKPLHSLSKAVTGAPFKPKPNPPHFLSPRRHSSTSSSSSLWLFRRFRYAVNGPIKISVGPRSFSFTMAFPKLPDAPWTPALLKQWSTWRHGIVTDSTVLGLILANIGVFVMWQVLDPDFMQENFMVSVDNINGRRLHTLITSAFSHTDVVDLTFNMIGLYLFGMITGRCLGVQAVVERYVLGAVLGSIGVLHQTYGTFHRDDLKTPGLGASGAVDVMMLFWLFSFPGTSFTLNSSKSVPALIPAVFLIGKDVLKIKGPEGCEQISGAAHLGAAAFATLIHAL